MVPWLVVFVGKDYLFKECFVVVGEITCGVPFNVGTLYVIGGVA